MEWIKTKDRLPDDYIPCLFMDKFEIERGRYHYMMEYGNYNPENKTFGYWDSYNDEEATFTTDEIVAWLPIPDFIDDEN